MTMRVRRPAPRVDHEARRAARCQPAAAPQRRRRATRRLVREMEVKDHGGAESGKMELAGLGAARLCPWQRRRPHLSAPPASGAREPVQRASRACVAPSPIEAPPLAGGLVEARYKRRALTTTQARARGSTALALRIFRSMRLASTSASALTRPTARSMRSLWNFLEAQYTIPPPAAASQPRTSSGCSNRRKLFRLTAEQCARNAGTAQPETARLLGRPCTSRSSRR